MTAPGKRNRLPSNVEIDVALERLGDNSSPPPVSSGSFAHVSSVSGSIPIQQDEYVKLPFSFGDVISGKYEIVGLIGAGGVGFVVSAMHLELGEMVALKFLREQSLAYPEVVDRFAREARAAARIKSEYVARVFDVGSLPNGMPFIVMEYLHGKDLADVVREKGASDEDGVGALEVLRRNVFEMCRRRDELLVFLEGSSTRRLVF